MHEAEKLFKRILFYYLLLAGNIITCGNILPDIFPFRNASTIYLLLLSVVLVFYYFRRVTPGTVISVLMKVLSYSALFLILLRGIKYSVFAEMDVLARHTWYFYYIPLFLMPLILFYISLWVLPKRYGHTFGIQIVTAVFTAFFIILVLTNDIHQLIFKFKPDLSDWNGNYSHTWLFYAINIWQYLLYAAAVIILVKKCRISSSKKNAWIILIPFVAGIAMCALLMTGKMPRLNGSYITEFPETLIFMAVIVLECCMQLGLIPTNTDYEKLFREFSIAAQITDKNGKPVYRSYTAEPLSREQTQMQSGARIGEHSVLNKMEIPAGFGFWQEDMTQLDRLNEELADAKEKLAQDAELIRLRSELKERRIKIEQRTLVYNTIAKRTQSQSRTISFLAAKARRSTDAEQKEKYLERIMFLNAYIKRYANMMLLSQDNNVINTGELGLSVSEMLRYLNFCGIPSECIIGDTAAVKAAAALAAFEVFETLTEAGFDCLKGVFVNLSVGENIMLKMTFENMTKTISDDVKKLSGYGIRTNIKCENNVTYISFELPKGDDSYAAF